ncbi:MAG: 1-acyl-sn-glycerol-3-phosphate acyltransferase [Archangiaceae bacterium]|nr:1-acyl-sn-glycerol-3-phosphate acyltransferase [Archangiaceae bacterium]
MPPKPPPPPKIVVPRPKAGDGTPARRAVASFASTPATTPPIPKVTAPERPSQKLSPPQVAAVPAARHIPEAHPGSPTVGADPIPHSASPEARHSPEFHPGSPELKAAFTAHDRSPEVVAELGAKVTTPHAGSPTVVRQRVTEAAVALGAARDTPHDLTRPLLKAAAGLAAAAKAALGLGGGAVDSWGKDEALTQKLHPVGAFLYDRYFRVTVERADRLPTGPSILVANHSGALPLDGPMLQYAVQRERPDLAAARWLVEDQVFHAPVLGVLMNRLGAVRAHPENAVRLLEEGRPVIVFPEGFLGISKPFTQRYQLKRFGRGGYVKLALKLKVPIVPVAIVGAEESMPLLAKLPGGMFGLPYLPLTPPPLPARWRIRFSEAVTVEGSPDDLAYVQDQNDLVRDTIAGMLTAMLGS